MTKEEISALTGTKTIYGYRQLTSVPDQEVKEYISRTRALFAPISRSFNNDLHTEWFIREYLALKYILAATVMGTSARYGRTKNLQITTPYLHYMMMLNCCRAFIFSLPCSEWDGVKSIEMTHGKIINLSTNGLARISKCVKDLHADRLSRARSQREAFSYRFPGQGLKVFNSSLLSFEEALDTAQLLCDLSQANFACLESSVRKHSNPPFKITYNSAIWDLVGPEGELSEFIDSDDSHRVSYFIRKHDRPCELSGLATEGLIEDFFGAWQIDEEDADGAYNPDQEWDLLIDVN